MALFKVFKIFGIFGYMGGPIWFSLFSAFGMVGISSVVKWIFTGNQLSDATKEGIFLTTMGGATGVTGTHMLFSKLRKARSFVATLGDEVNSTKPQNK